MVNTIQLEKGVRQLGSLAAAVTYASDFGTPVSIFHKLSHGSEYAFLFESTGGDGRLARFSFVGVDPLLTVSMLNGTATLQLPEGDTVTVPVSSPIELLQEILQKYAPLTTSSVPEELAEIPFLGGLVGYFGYGATQYLENICKQSSDPLGVPDAQYGLYDAVFIFDHQYRRVTVVSLRGEEHAQSLMERALASAVGLPPLRLSGGTIQESTLFDEVESPFSEQTFVSAVQRAKDFIYEGQAFQIVLSQRFSLKAQAQPIDIYRMLQATNPSPYAYFLKSPQFVYLGSSPETFVRCKDKQVTLRAIAGTRPRGISVEDDERLVNELKSNEKEMAEHRMLVDLGRNDLGRVCRPGTVKVGEIACLSKYTHVMHLETEITGSLDEKESFAAFKACFPAGTVSGAPKVRAMQLLHALEPEQRGIYSGCVGYFDLRGNMDGAIAIRSALIRDGKAHINAGAGIVYDSDPLAEYQETKNKAKSLIQAVKLANGVEYL